MNKQYTVVNLLDQDITGGERFDSIQECEMWINAYCLELNMETWDEVDVVEVPNE